MIRTTFIEPDQFYLVDEFCDSEQFPRMNPNFCKVVAAIDLETEKVVGIIAVQMILHAEPIWLKKAYQQQGLWREMCEMMEGYIVEMANQGVINGIYTQPTSDMTRDMCTKMGFQECEHPLFVRIFNQVPNVILPELKGDS